MNFLYLVSSLPILCTLGVGVTLVNDVCPELNDRVIIQKCFDSVIIILIVGLIAGISIALVVYFTDRNNSIISQKESD